MENKDPLAGVETFGEWVECHNPTSGVNEGIHPAPGTEVLYSSCRGSRFIPDREHIPIRLLPEPAVRKAMEEIQNALEESVKLQSHYAKLLNAWDGGQRIGFKSAKEWIQRLRVPLADRLERGEG